MPLLGFELFGHSVFPVLANVQGFALPSTSAFTPPLGASSVSGVAISQVTLHRRVQNQTCIQAVGPDRLCCNANKFVRSYGDGAVDVHSLRPSQSGCVFVARIYYSSFSQRRFHV